MAHEIAFDPADPLLARVRAIAMALPGAQEKVSHGRPAFCTRKVFAFSAGTTKADHAEGLHPRRLTVLLEPDERLAMLEEGAIEPAHLAPYGWIAVDLEGADWDLVAELIDASYRVTATKRLVAELDARG